MSTLWISTGLPGSGKSWFARKKVSGDKNFVRVNRDDIRGYFTVCDGKWNHQREKTTVMIRDAMIRAALQDGKDVLCDDTNLDPKVQNHLKAIARECGATVMFEDHTDITPQECIKRDLERLTSVGADVIWNMYRKYLKPEPVKQNPDLPHIIIVDLDGTLALCGDRDIYDDARADVDHVNEPVATMVRAFLTARPDVSLICMSGRDEGRSRNATAGWLVANDLLPAALFMRKAGDMRHDTIIKRELFDEHIRDKYFVEFCVDDRAGVTQMWRDDLGLPVFQVDFGLF